MDFPTHTHRTPLPYDPSYEIEEEDEAETVAGLNEALHGISVTTFKDGGHGLRSVHAKSHGLLHGRLRVLDHLAPDYAQGMFATPGNWPVVMRLSSTPGDLLDDNVSTPRGLALKVVGVQGVRLPGGEAENTQDFVLVNGPVFLAPTAKRFLGSVKLLAATTDKAPGLKKALSAALRGTERALEAVGGESATLKGLGGHPETHLLGETYFSQAPILFGHYMAKVALVPVAPSLTALTDKELDLSGKPDGLREAVIDYFSQHEAEWELRVQLCTDLQSMPIEDSSVEWPQEQSPYVAVARLTAPRQAGWSRVLSVLVDDGMQFSPWHCVAAHRPIGSIMRVRRAVYAMSARFRTERNGAPLRELSSLDELLPLFEAPGA